MTVMSALFGSASGQNLTEILRISFCRAFRTLLQGVAGAFPSAGAGTAVLSTGYWDTFGYACLAAIITAVVSFLHNVANFLPTDPVKDGGSGG